MNTVVQTFDVVGMSRDHRARSVGEEICKIDSVDSVDVDLVSGIVTVTGGGELDPIDVAAAIDEAGYALAS